MKTTEMCKLEKGEYTHLLGEEEDVKTAAMTGRKPFSWIRCLLWTVCIAVIVFVLGSVFFAAGAYFWMRHQVRRFTIVGTDGLPEPPLPVTPVPAAHLEVIKDKGKLFWDQLRAGEPAAEDFVITQDDLNGLIASSDYLRGHAYVTLSENKWYTDLVLPADGLPGGKGRYFLGHGVVTTQADTTGTTHVETELTPKHRVPGLDFTSILLGKYLAYRDTDDTPVVELDYGQFLNWVAPSEWLARRENLLSCDTYDSSDSSSSDDKDDDDMDCEEFMTTVARLESITLEENKIVFIPRRKEKTTGGRRHLTASSATKKEAKPSWRGAVLRRVLRGAF